MMDKRLINTLLRIFHSPETRFTSGRAISDFCVEYNLGVRRGNSLVFNDACQSARNFDHLSALNFDQVSGGYCGA